MIRIYAVDSTIKMKDYHSSANEKVLKQKHIASLMADKILICNYICFLRQYEGFSVLFPL